MKTLGILLILMGTVYNTPPFHTLYNRMIKDFMNGIVLAAERNETDLITEIFQLSDESGKKTALELIQILKMIKFDVISVKSSSDHQTLEARMIISGRIEKVFPKFSTTWFLKRI
ncbi:Protein CBG26730 [Caenorhabditis briggsae]|uniref:Protein CBG26730 n=1 Tax=Caenorhabditis briggsae TaxID=6238 RepID=B6IEA5_CAEBR|nr:Protein CBG26730 [Caenorhabditis briggsae]CAS01169.1 Protein CBG26730 [Caenorhabditis briggsae]